MQVRDAYDLIAANYAALLPDMSLETSLDRAVIDEFADSIGTRDRTVLDLGCGTGRLSGYLCDRALDVIGLDPSPGMLAEARRLHPSIRFAVGSATAIPLPDAAVDAVVAWYSIIHSPSTDLPVIAAEIRRVLRPEGTVLLAFQVGEGVRRIHRAYGLDVDLDLEAVLHSPNTVSAEFTNAGFEPLMTLVRAPLPIEKHEQARLLMRRGDASGATAGRALGLAR